MNTHLLQGLSLSANCDSLGGAVEDLRSRVMYVLKLSGVLIGFGAGFSFSALPSAAQWVPHKTLHISDTRDLAFCEIVPIERGASLIYFYNTTGNSDCSPLLSDHVDTKNLAKKLGAELVLLNSKRRWLQDQLWIYQMGETKDFDGLRATMIASTEPFFIKEAMKAHFSPIYVFRRTKSVYQKGKPIFLVRSPSGKAWIMQSYTTHVDKSLTINTLAYLRVQLSMPPGWSFETKILDRDLIIETGKSGLIEVVRDEVHNLYDACSAGDTCNYVP